MGDELADERRGPGLRIARHRRARVRSPTRRVEAVETCTHRWPASTAVRRSRRASSRDGERPARLRGPAGAAPAVHAGRAPASTGPRTPSAAATSSLPLELARLDARGVRWLRGVRRNLAVASRASTPTARGGSPFRDLSAAGARRPEKAALVASAPRPRCRAARSRALTALAPLVDDHDALLRPAASLWAAAGRGRACRRRKPPTSHAQVFRCRRGSRGPQAPRCPQAPRLERVEARADHGRRGGECALARRREAGPPWPRAEPATTCFTTATSTAWSRASTLATARNSPQLRSALETDLRRHALGGGAPGQAADARAHGATDGASGGSTWTRAYIDGSRLARLVASWATRARSRSGKRLTVPRHGRHAAHRPLRVDARPAHADRRAHRRDLRARARALRRALRGARVHHPRVGRRRACPGMGRGAATRRIQGASTGSSTSSSRAPTCRGAARAHRRWASSCATRC